MSMGKPGTVAWVLGVLLFISLSACSGASAESCDVSTLRKLKEIPLQGLRIVTGGGPSPQTTQGAGFKAYYQGEDLKVFEMDYLGETGRTDIQYWVLSENSYLAGYHTSHYAESIYQQPNVEIAKQFGNLFFVCDGKVIKTELLNGIEPLKANFANEILWLIQTYRDTYKKLMSKHCDVNALHKIQKGLVFTCHQVSYPG